jgi:hypothetical protein
MRGLLVVASLLAGCHLVFPHLPAVSRDGAARDLAGEWRRDALTSEPRPDSEPPRTCLLGGVVHAKGDADPTDNCRICDPAFAAAFWAPAAGCLITLPTPKLDDPHGLALLGTSLLVTEEAGRRVQRIELSNGATSTLADYPTVDGPRGLRLHGTKLHVVEAYADELSILDADAGVVAASGLFKGVEDPYDVVVDAGGVPYLCDSATSAIYKGTLSSTLPLASHGVLKPSALALAGSLLFVADQARVFSYDLGAASFALVAGGPSCNESLPGTACLSSRPQGLALDGKKRILIVDSYHHRVIRIDGKLAVEIAGKKYESGNADGPLGVNRLTDPAGIAVHGDYVFIADKGNDRIRALRPPP